MRFSEQWLREWVNPTASTEELAHQLTMAGLEVEGIEPVAGSFTGVVVGEVLSVEPHPDADKLRVCRVNSGGEAPLTIVCGAANVRAGMRVPTAVVGAQLPGLAIKKAKLRGVESFGMLCSAKELGLAESSSGLMELPGDAPVGTDVREYLALDDVAIELSLTPNRSDCLSIAGIAREVGVLYRAPVNGPVAKEIPAQSDASLAVTVEAPEGCPRYAGRFIQGIDNRAVTPLWMRERLRRSGLRSVSPVVDVTNYVLLELGQPMHAFDADKVTDGIVVRYARSGELVQLLDDTELKLEPDCLVIADGKGVQALAGVMGGKATAVEEGTRNIFLESAFFTPETIAGRARRYGLHTDSSHRFERGVSPDLQRRAVERASELLLDIVGGTPGPVVEVRHEAQLPQRNPVLLRQSRLEKLLGMAVPEAETADILRRLGMGVEQTAEGWRVTPPAFRFDVAIEEDLIEEVGRIYGYDRLPSTPPVGSSALLPQPEGRLPLYDLLEGLIARGYQEAITYSFVEPGLQKLFDPEKEPMALANPISAEMSVMRTSLWPGLVQALQHNLNRQQGRVRLIEWGLVFVPEGGDVRQETALAGVVCGSAYPLQWGERARDVDFFDIKGDLEALFAMTGEVFKFVPAQNPALHPGQSAAIELHGRQVGWLGALHPAIQQKLGLPRTFVFQVALGAIEQRRIPAAVEISRFPAIRRDIAILVDRAIPAERVFASVRGAAPSSLQELKLFDVYEGEGIDSERKSLAFALTLQDNSRTLTDDEVDAAIAQVVAALKAELGASLRE